MKQFFTVVLFLVVLFPAVSDEYKICYSSVTLKENAEYIARGLENNGVKTVFEPTVVFNRDYIRILSAETYTSLQEALRVKDTLSRKSFARTLGLTSMWIRAYPEGYPASGFVSTDIPDIPGPAPRPAEPARTTAQPAPAAVPAARPAPPESPAAARPAPPETPADTAPTAGVPEITASPPAPEAEPAATPEPPAPQPEPGPPVQAEPAPPVAPPVRSVEPAPAPAAEPGQATESPVEAEPGQATESPVEAEPPVAELEAEPEPVPDIPEPAAAPVSETVPEVEPEAEPVTEDIPEVVEEEAPEPTAADTAEVTIKPKAAPEAPAKSKPEVPAVEDIAPPAAPKPERDVPAGLTPPVTEEMPAEPTPPAVAEEEPESVVEEAVPEEPAVEETEPAEEQPVAEESVPAVEEVTEEPAVTEPPAEQPESEDLAMEAAPAAVETFSDEAPEPTSTEPDAVFAFHRDNFLSAYEYLRTFADEGDSEEAARLAGSIPMFLDMAEAILEDFAAYLPDPLSDYEKENPEAKDIRLSSKASFLKNSYIPDARENLESLKNDILAAMESDAEWLASEYANIKYAPAALERIKDNAETLKTIASEDTDLLSRSQAVLAEAEESYAALSGKIAENRMPAEKYEEDDAAQLKAEMAVLYEALFPGEMVRKVVIVSEDWREEASAEIKDGKIVAGVYRYIHAALAITRERDENATVYTIGFRRTWTGTGDEFGPVELYSIGSSYPILPENIGE